VEPWLPFAEHAAERSVEAQAANSHSVLALYRRIVAVRNASAALRQGGFQWLPAPERVLAYERRLGGERWWVVVNLGDEAAEAVLPGAAEVVVTSDDPTTPAFELAGPVRLRPDTAVVLRALG
jgi:alpha-glucosidase